jgi:hypothetical protein
MMRKRQPPQHLLFHYSHLPQHRLHHQLLTTGISSEKDTNLTLLNELDLLTTDRHHHYE